MRKTFPLLRNCCRPHSVSADDDYKKLRPFFLRAALNFRFRLSELIPKSKKKFCSRVLSPRLRCAATRFEVRYARFASTTY